MKIRILLHKPKKWDILGQLIRFWTWLISAKNRTIGGYDHTEVWTPRWGEIFEVPKLDFKTQVEIGSFYLGTCWTSTMKDKAKGTVKRPASDVIHNPARWDYIEVELTDDQYDDLLTCMEWEVRHNKGYGILDFAKFFGLGWLIRDKNRNICSEFVNNALWKADVLDKFGVVSPRRLAYLLNAKGFATRRLKG